VSSRGRSARQSLIVATAAIAVAVAAILTRPFWSTLAVAVDLPPTTFGTVGEWVSGVGAVAAIAVALAESGAARRRERLDKLCAVAAWIDLGRNPEDDSREWSVSSSNGTDYPIYQWVVIPRPTSVTGTTASWHLCARRHGPLVPGLNQFAIPTLGFEFGSAVPVELRFQDRDGQRWRRDPAGRLDRLRRAVAQTLGGHDCEFCEKGEAD